MCGLAGMAALQGSLPPELRGCIQPMTDALAHRGPDGRGFFSDSRVALGHRRLAIIDREAGHQPMSNEDGSCWIVFNGEIYNHHEVRRTLASKGHVFRTRSDTEVIVHAFEQYGAGCVDHLEGMFAFAVYDQRSGEVFVARDRLGKKPLFFATFAGVLHFASEIKALKTSPAWDGSIDADQLESYLLLGYTLAPRTIYRHVHELEPGFWLRIAAGRAEVRRYWDVERFDDFEGTEQQAIDCVRDSLDERVRERLEGEVPLGAFLSGGIDSGLVVSSMAAAHTDRVVTISIGFGDRRHNELEPAGLTAAAYRTEHHAHVVEPNLDAVMDPIAAAFDQPFADSSSVPTWYVSREARRHVTVALSGDGGDETFAGYTFRYRPHAIESQIRRAIPGAALRSAVGALGERWPHSRRLPRVLRWGTFLENIGREPEAAYFSDLCFLQPDDGYRLLGRPDRTEVRDTALYARVTAPYLRCPSASAVQRAEYADLKTYLPNDVLAKVDRMSMQHSLEVRCPLLDRRLVEIAFRIPQSIKQGGRRGKHILKQIARSRLPEALLRSPKRGFSAPVGSWIAGQYRSRFESEVLGSQSALASLIDIDVARGMFAQHVSGARDRSYALWALWVLERWAATASRQCTDRLLADC